MATQTIAQFLSSTSQPSTSTPAISDNFSNFWTALNTQTSLDKLATYASVTDTAVPPVLAIKVTGVVTATQISSLVTLASNTASVKAVLTKVTGTGGISVFDSVANIVNNLASLEAAYKLNSTLDLLGSITLSGSTASTLTISSAQLTDNIDVVKKITNTNYIVSIGSGTFTASAVADLQTNANGVFSKVSAGTIAISDSAANLAAVVNAQAVSWATVNGKTSLNTLLTKLGSVALTDSAALALTADAVKAGNTLLEKISGSFSVNVSSGTFSISDLSALTAATKTYAALGTASINIADSSANLSLSAKLATLQSAVNKINVITTTDAGAITVSSTDLIADSALLNKITSSNTVSVTGSLTAQNVLTLSTNFANLFSHLNGLAIIDSAATVKDNFAALQAVASKITTITLNDGSAAPLTVSNSELIADSVLLNKISNASPITVTGSISVDNLKSIQTNYTTLYGHLNSSALSINDTASNVSNNLASLSSAFSKISTITLSDSSTPISVTNTALISNADVLNKITTSNPIAVTGSLSTADALAVKANYSTLYGHLVANALNITDTTTSMDINCIEMERS